MRGLGRGGLRRHRAFRDTAVIALGEGEHRSFYEIIEASYPFGWRTFDNACLEAFEQGLITEETAMLYCTKRSVVCRGIDNMRKSRGEMSQSAGMLRMKPAPPPHPHHADTESPLFVTLNYTNLPIF